MNGFKSAQIMEVVLSSAPCHVFMPFYTWVKSVLLLTMQSPLSLFPTKSCNFSKWQLNEQKKK